MNVSICVLTFNRKEILAQLLDSLVTLEYPGIEIIVVDNHSEDGTDFMMQSGYKSVLYVRMDSNLGVAARNTGILRSSGDLIITIDDDVFGLTDNKIRQLVEYFENSPVTGALNFKVLDSETGEVCNWIHHRREEEWHASEFQSYEISEGAVALRRKALNEAGLYPEYFFLSHEGPDLAYRIINAGFEVRYSGNIAVSHLHAEAGRKSWYRYYYDTRNQFYLAVRNFPVLYSLGYLSRGILSTLFYSLRDGFFRYWIKGMFDGAAGLFRYRGDRNVLSKDAMKVIQDIDSYRPSLFYMVKKSVFRKEMRL